MEARRFGTTGLEVAPLGMGCARLGAFWQGRSIAEGRRALEAAVGGGVTFFDTADSYTRGISERLVGRVSAPVRDQVVLCTKVGSLKTPAAARLARRHGCAGSPPRGGVDRARALAGAAGGQCFDSAYVVQAARRSLRRLGTDHLDLLLLHSPDAAAITQGAFLDGLERLRRSGAVRAVGISCDTVDAGWAALGTGIVDCLEVPYNVDVRHETEPLLSAAAQRGVAVVARSVFGDGALLRGAGGGTPATIPSDRLAQAHLQLALGAPAVAVALAGMTRPEHVRANVDAVGRAPLPAPELERLLSGGGGPGRMPC